MNLIKKACCRAVQIGFRAAIPILPYREPERFACIDEVAELLQKNRPIALNEGVKYFLAMLLGGMVIGVVLHIPITIGLCSLHQSSYLEGRILLYFPLHPYSCG